ncbi:hypothetical protein [Streptomyces sp. NBC_01217]|nr:hypothetical protein OG507_22740 [Streptomyces sp. NBC_01217]
MAKLDITKTNPAFERLFNPMLRMYRPKQEVLNGTWSPPPITPAP